MDHIAMAETLEAQASALRREHARLELAGQPALELETPDDGWRGWQGGDGPPTEANGRNVDVELSSGEILTGPANAFVWTWAQAEPHPSSRDIVDWRLSAEQPAE